MPVENDGAKHFWDVKGLIEKWHDPEDYKAGKAPDEVTEVSDNELTTAGLDAITKRIIGVSQQAWDATHCRVGVGSANTPAFSAGQTDLQAASNKRWALMESTYPQQTNGVMTFRGVFDSSEANYAWEEWAIDQGTADGGTVTAPMMNRKVVSMGTKVSPAVWTFTVTITLS